MKNLTLVLAALIAGNLAVTGCSADKGSVEATPDVAEATPKLGELAMSLRATGSDGTTFRLRNAQFEIYGYYYYDNNDGGVSAPRSYTANSEDHLDDSSISLSVEQGSYSVSLQNGWYMERLGSDGSAERVEAQLLSSSYQYLYVSPRNTSWVAFNFGIGGRKLWFNGEAQIAIGVYEDPDDYYGAPYPSYYPSAAPSPVYPPASALASAPLPPATALPPATVPPAASSVPPDSSF
jgi:outer membrane murein-binding lipoprotein Lpp